VIPEEIRAKIPGDFGRIRGINDKYAHRMSWRIFRGEIPPGACVLHRCDNRLCVNPDHLFLGDEGVNAQDMKAKGRHLYGERNAKAKLSEAQVFEIHRRYRAGDGSTHTLAREYGVGQMAISRLLRGERWTHVRDQIDAAQPSRG
jgi:hypothetical protein